MPYRVESTRAAGKELAKIFRSFTVKERRNFANTIDSLAEDPRPHGVENVENSGGLLRVRHRDWRIVYRVEDEALIVLIVRVAHRREVYRRLPG